MTRLCKLRGFNGFVGGKDNDGVFEEGVVYDVKNILGEIILTPVGNEPIYSKSGSKIDMQTLNQILVEGEYLIPLKTIDDEA
jgi:hypothetical protein